MSISETEVRRILAAFRPQEGTTILLVERSSRSEKDLQLNRWLRQEFMALEGKKGITLPELPNYDLSKSHLVLTIRVGARPLYPRHNAKIPEEQPHC